MYGSLTLLCAVYNFLVGLYANKIASSSGSKALVHTVILIHSSFAPGATTLENQHDTWDPVRNTTYA